MTIAIQSQMPQKFCTVFLLLCCFVHQKTKGGVEGTTQNQLQTTRCLPRDYFFFWRMCALSLCVLFQLDSIWSSLIFRMSFPLFAFRNHVLQGNAKIGNCSRFSVCFVNMGLFLRSGRFLLRVLAFYIFFPFRRGSFCVLVLP